MNKSKVLFSVIAIAFGIFLFIYGEADDSPGGQGLGLLLVILGTIGVFKRPQGSPDQPGTKDPSNTE